MGKDDFTKQWIIDNSVNICSRYADGILTLRALHYQLVGLGMTNDVQHYKRVVSAMISARWDNLISFEKFSDLDRTMVGETRYKATSVDESVNEATEAIYGWMNYYSKNRWENQDYYPEVFIEKKALQGVFSPICRSHNVTLGACKGYPSLTFLHDAAGRFIDAVSDGKNPIIIYFGDYDPSGEDIPRSIEENMNRFGVDIEVRRIALMRDQVIEMNLPPAPAKIGDSRTANWDGLGQVELDAIKPEILASLCSNAIADLFDNDKYADLLLTEKEERSEYKSRLINYIQEIKDDNE